MKVMLVYNSHAAQNRAGKLLPEVETLFNKYGIEFNLFITDYPEHATEIVSNANLEEYDGLVAGGGDGTLFEVLNGYFQNPGTQKPPLGVLPVGTGNSFSLDLGLGPSKWEEAIEIISLNKPKKVDVGYFKSHGQEYYYLNILGVGFVADVTAIARKLKIFGNLSYTLGVLYRILFLRSKLMTVTMDGKPVTRNTIFVEVSNSRYTADFLMAPNAKLDDGLLDITLLRKASRLRLLQSFPKIFTGEHIHLDEMEIYQAKKITIESDIPGILTPDGELLGITPVEIECLPGAIEIFQK